MNNNHKEDAATLEILQTIESKRDVTQRHLAERLDIALGLANSYLKRCVVKGLVKIHQAPANRYFYYLTPKGFAEKSRLTAEYLSNSFSFYRSASTSCSVVFEECNKQGYQKVLLCGLSELAEIATLRSKESSVDIVGVFDQSSSMKLFLGLSVWNSFDLVSDFDACVITDVKNPQDSLKYLEKKVMKEIVFVPDILGIH